MCSPECSPSQWGREFRARRDVFATVAVGQTVNESQWGREFRARRDAFMFKMASAALRCLNGAANSARVVTSPSAAIWSFPPSGLNGAANSARVVTPRFGRGTTPHARVSMGPRIPRAS